MKRLIVMVGSILSLVLAARGGGQRQSVAKEAEASSFVQITLGAPSATGGYYQIVRNSHLTVGIRATILTVAVPGGAIAERQILLSPGQMVSLGDSVVQGSDGMGGYGLVYAITAAKFEPEAKKPSQMPQLSRIHAAGNHEWTQTNTNCRGETEL